MVMDRRRGGEAERGGRKSREDLEIVAALQVE
jgi:hypothetical protein